ncbi:MAG: Xaa-Pro peptidase family protein [Candidatus Bathyarchaeia archaeon]
MRKDVDKILAEKGAEAIFLYSESVKEANMYYLTKFLAPDPFIYLKKVGEEPILIVSQMEYSRAKKESIIKNVCSYMDYNIHEIIKAAPDPKIGSLKLLANVAKKELGMGTKICVPPNFPAIIVDALRSEGLTIMPMFDVVEKARETKEPDELQAIQEVQAIVDKVTKKVIDLIADADVDNKGRLVVRIDGRREVLTVGKVKVMLGHEFLDNGCASEDPIVACGPRGADPHYSGSPEDELMANQPIILDIYPQSIRKRYYTDMTRTIVKGKAPKEIKKMFEAVLEARNASIDAIRAGVLGNEPYNICCDVFEKAGYATTRGGKQITKGFTHGLGHGVGLQVHEGPSLSEFYKFALEEHNVVTVEPGLYDPKLGGVRIEDTVEVSKKGCNNFVKTEILLEI